MDTQPNLSIVIPAYNESARLLRAFDAIISNFAGQHVEVIIVDDGSTDGTADVARSLDGQAIPVVVVQLNRNQGKGAAVRAGVQRAIGEKILIMDADLATDLRATESLTRALETAEIAIGSRAVPGSRVHDTSPLRRVMGRTFNRLSRLILGLEIADSQCGFKMFRSDAAKLLFTMSCVDGFAFDAEVLRLAMILNMTVIELPVEWTAIADSKVKPIRDSVRTFLDLLMIRRQVEPQAIKAWAVALGWPSETGRANRSS